MDRPQLAGIVFGIAASVVGAYGLIQTKPLPLSAKLGVFAPLDRNDDGRVSGTEWQAAGREQTGFSTLDKNRDGFVGPKEVPRKRRGGGE